MIDLSKLNWATVKSFFRQLAAIAGLAVTISNADHLPTAVRSVVASVSGTLLIIDHYVEKSGGTTAPPTKTGA